LFIAVAKTMTPSVSAPQQRGQPTPDSKNLRGGFKVVLAWKAIVYTDLLPLGVLFINQGFN
jgi:hypothetical protein